MKCSMTKLRILGLLLTLAVCRANITTRTKIRHLPIKITGGGGAATTASTNAASSSPLQIFYKTIMDSRRHLAAAAAARCTSIFTMYPIDTLKTRMQMGDTFQISWNKGGIMKGVSGSLIGQVPYGVLTFGSYEVYKEALLKKFPNVKPVFIYAMAAIMGDVTGSGWLCPSEVVKQQMQAGMYPTTGDAVRSIWSKSGFGGFYQGYIGGLARDVPFRVAQLTSYEVAKKVFLRAKQQRLNDDSVELSAVDSAVVGAIAGTFSAAITAPLDKIKTLLMTDGSKYGGSVLQCASTIVKSDGIGGLFAGLVPRVVYIAPSVTIFFVVYEQVQQRLMLSSSDQR